MTARPLDLVVYGATGFTGGLIVQYLSRYAPEGTRWAVGGRDGVALQALHDRLQGAACPPAGVCVAEAHDRRALRRLARDTGVVLSAVGPFAELGLDLVAACVAEGTDYCDLAGEPAFVDRVVDAHHDAARDAGLRIVPSCGFDAVPHDLGVLYTLQHLPEGVPVKVEGFVRMRASMSGGTWHSAVHAFGAYFDHQRWRRRHRPAPPAGRRIRRIRPHVRWEREIRGWACPLPTIDARVVLRSARLDQRYGPDFRYGHYVRVHRLPTVLGGAAAAGAVFALAQLGPTRDLLLRAREPGGGPTERQRARGWFRVTFVGRGGGRTVLTEVTGGDPGYEESSRMAAEAALCLVHERGALPARAGVLTPATAFGDVLRGRLEELGIGFRVVREMGPAKVGRRWRRPARTPV